MNQISKSLLSTFIIFSLIIIIISFFTEADIQYKLNIAGYSMFGGTVIILLILLIYNYKQQPNNITDIIPFSLMLMYILLKLGLLITHQDKLSLMNVSKDYYIFLYISLCITIFQMYDLININNYSFEIIFENLSEIKKAVLIFTSVINIVCVLFMYSILSLNITDG
jgi:hypothetical protein